MKNRSSTVTSSGKDRGASVKNRPKALQTQRFIKGWLRRQFSWIGKASCFLNCFRGMKRLIRVCTVDNWTNQVMPFGEKRPELVNCKEVVFRHDKTPYIIGDSSEIVAARMGRVYHILLIHQTCSPSDFHLFRSPRNLWLRRRCQNLVPGSVLWPQKTRTFFEHRITKLLEKWQKA